MLTCRCVLSPPLLLAQGGFDVALAELEDVTSTCDYQDVNGLARSTPEHVGAKLDTNKLQDLCRRVHEDNTEALIGVLSKRLPEDKAREQFCVAKAKLCKKGDLWTDEHMPENR